jgi:porphobilinogen synthase
MIKRMRRLRQQGIRDLVTETRLSMKNMIQPIFVDAKLSQPKAIDSMPGQQRQSLDSIAEEAAALEN